MKLPLGLLLAALLLAPSGCRAPPPPLPQAAYVWQRQWTPPLTQALARHAPNLAAFKLLMLERERNDQWFVATPDFAALRATNRPLWLVVRINGQQRDLSAQALMQQLAPMWQAAPWRGVEIDYDCARSGLAGYGEFLRELRTHLPPDILLSFTALPDWLRAPIALTQLRQSAAQSVLQVHAVASPAQGLFAPAQASDWIAAYAALSPEPFEVALPAYGVAVRWDASGQPEAWAAESPVDAADLVELRVDPRAIAQMVATIERAPPPQLLGWSWFRLPLPTDRRAFSPKTFSALLARQPLAAQFDVTTLGVDVQVRNRGNLDALAPSVSAAGLRCIGDGHNGYRLAENNQHWQFTAPVRIIKAGSRLTLGWLRCDSPAILSLTP